MASRVPMKERQYDVSSFIASRMGSAYHDSIEKAWTTNYAEGLQKLGYSKEVIEAVRVNPDVIEPGTVPVFFEQRAEKQIEGYTVSGKFDMCIEGQLYDFKSTSVYSYILGGRENDYILQGSLYRWLHPDKITKDTIQINFIFTDFQNALARTQKDYPSSRIVSREYDLMSYDNTEAWVIEKIREFEKYKDLPEWEIPPCTPEDLWQKESTFKYYSNPDKTTGRSTRNFTTFGEAEEFRLEKGKGIVIESKEEPKACAYCDGFAVCEQRRDYFPD